VLHIWSYLTARLGRDDGATMVEYGMIVAAIAIVVVVAAIALGATVFGWFDDASQAVVPG